MKKSPQKISQQVRKKQISATLNELHRLQSEIYQLNIPQNPHSSAPVKKQIKQLTYLYENMTKPKVKNNLNIEKKDIQQALKIIQGTKQEENISVDSKKLGNLIKNMFGSEFDVNLINKHEEKSTIFGQKKSKQIKSQQIYQFINYSEFDNFDPIKQTYNLFVNEDGKFNIKKYKQLHSSLGFSNISNQNVFRQILSLQPNQELSFQIFQKIIKE